MADDRAELVPFSFDIVDGATMREKVVRLEEMLRKYPQLPEKLTHHFSAGIYARELCIPKDAVIVGKTHRHAHLNFLVKGDISVLTEHGIQRLKAPAVITSAPGIKRAGYAHEETIWITVHATTETDVEKIEDQVICNSFDEFERIAADEVKQMEVM
jgi:quercetin dioxygenase-like cupin family protein